MRSRLLILGLATGACFACYDFDTAYGDYCDAGRCDGGATGGGSGGGAADDAGAGGGGASDDAGTGGGGGDDAGVDDAGVDDAGTEDAGVEDAGTDAGCGTPFRLVITAAAQTMTVGDCSMPVTVQLRDACGMPVMAPMALPLSFTTPPSLSVFSEGACIAMPPQWQLPGGSSEVTVYVKGSAPGTPTLQVSSAGLAPGSQSFTVTCPALQRACSGACIANDACCTNAECNDGGVAWVCNASNTCAPPPCGAFPSGCSTWDDRTATSASRTVTFDSNGYAPKCMRVLTYQQVTFSGTFAIHPLVQDCGPSDRQLTTTFGTTKTATFPTFGEYGYHCANHPVFERGAIKVP